MKNDLCLSCHPQYQGPFFYNHPPVEENCNICHEPHGAVVNNLLSKTEPFLCAQCHYFHPPIHIEPSLAQTVGKRCIYCHQEIHGSNIAPNLGLK
jgi:predicted CXXCH cytochrome family protein